MEIKSTPEVEAVGYEEGKSILATVTLSAPEVATATNGPAEASLDDTARAPLDILVVLDVSGSMSGAKVATLIETMEFLVEQLGPKDRLCICTFNHSSQQLTPFYLMTNDRKPAVTEIVRALRADGGTNIEGALVHALRILTARQDKNIVSSVLLLSDGQSSRPG